LPWGRRRDSFQHPVNNNRSIQAQHRALLKWPRTYVQYVGKIPLIDGNRNILQIPFRRSHTVSLSTALTQYISTKYDQRPDMFADDLLIIDRLRSEAINVQEPHVSGISRLVTYAAQLKWLGGKFPVDVRINNIIAIPG
jgi:hypothetical protein